MAKIMYFNVPAHGHVNPTLPVVAELRRRGHEILYYNSPDFRPQIERTGATFRAYGDYAPTSAEISEAVGGSLIDVTLLLFRSAARMLPDLNAEIEREQPDFVIYDSLALGAALAVKRTGTPAICSITTFILKEVKGVMTPRDWLHFVSELLPRIRRLSRARRALVEAYGQPLPETLIPMAADLNIVFTSREVQPQTEFIDERFAFVGPSLDPNTRASEAFPFEQIARSPLIYISLGTIHNDKLEFYRRCFEAFKSSPAQVILSVGGATDLKALEPIPDNFIVRASVPQLEILQRADLFITHGGMNSVQESLYFGVPMVVIPQQFEQLFNGRIVARSRAGVLVNHANVAAQQLRAAADKVLSDSAYRETAQQLGESLRTAGGYSRAAALIEAFAARVGARDSIHADW